MQELTDQIVTDSPDAVARRKGHDACLKFLNALHSIMLRRLGSVGREVTVRRTDLIDQLLVVVVFFFFLIKKYLIIRSQQTLQQEHVANGVVRDRARAAVGADAARVRGAG
jgi:hypothetical protein